MRAATSWGSMNGIPRSPANPEVRSVWHSDGRTTDISTPVPRSSIATASEKPATPNFVATYVAQCDPRPCSPPRRR